MVSPEAKLESRKLDLKPYGLRLICLLNTSGPVAEKS